MEITPAIRAHEPVRGSFFEEYVIRHLGTRFASEMPATVTPMVFAIPVQLITRHTAAIMGKDVDQSRNLAKSATVE
jgi:glucosamine--fructose-6-phosphate aminotransferase (isomerizing)